MNETDLSYLQNKYQFPISFIEIYNKKTAVGTFRIVLM